MNELKEITKDLENTKEKINQLEERITELEMSDYKQDTILEQMLSRYELIQENQKMINEQLQEQTIIVRTFLAEERVRHEKQDKMFNFVIPAILSGIVGIIVTILLRGI